MPLERWDRLLRVAAVNLQAFRRPGDRFRAAAPNWHDEGRSERRNDTPRCRDEHLVGGPYDVYMDPEQAEGQRNSLVI